MGKYKARREGYGRNDLCPCGSGRKYKYCHYPHEVVPRRVRLDWMASFFEEEVRPRFHEMSPAFQREYTEIYHEWASSPLIRSEDDGPTKCLHLVDVAENHQREIASRHPRRFLVQAIRTLPLSVLRLMTQVADNQTLLELMRLATKSAHIFAESVREERVLVEEGRHALLVTRKQLDTIKDDLGGYLARFLGATYARIVGSRAFRCAGKGARLLEPMPVPETAWSIFDNCPSNGLVMLPCPEYERNEGLERSMEEYDERRRRAMVMGSSGLAFTPHQLGSGRNPGPWRASARRG